MIPKIYIKKPPVSKEILPSHVNVSNKEPIKPEEKSIEDDEEQEENKVEPVISHEKEVVLDKKSNGISELPKIESKFVLIYIYPFISSVCDLRIQNMRNTST